MNSVHWLPAVRAAMDRMGMSQADLAARLKVHKATVTLWFQGEGRLKPIMRKRIARILHRTQAELFEKETP